MGVGEARRTEGGSKDAGEERRTEREARGRVRDPRAPHPGLGQWECRGLAGRGPGRGKGQQLTIFP